jgi:hypothetical protein
VSGVMGFGGWNCRGLGMSECWGFGVLRFGGFGGLWALVFWDFGV